MDSKYFESYRYSEDPWRVEKYLYPKIKLSNLSKPFDIPSFQKRPEACIGSVMIIATTWNFRSQKKSTNKHTPSNDRYIEQMNSRGIFQRYSLWTTLHTTMTADVQNSYTRYRKDENKNKSYWNTHIDNYRSSSISWRIAWYISKAR